MYLGRPPIKGLSNKTNFRFSPLISFTIITSLTFSFTVNVGVCFELLLGEIILELELDLILCSEGDVFVFYNVKGAPEIEKEDGYEVHKINEKGYYATSTKDLDYGTITDKYFYVNDKGRRTPIDNKCVSLFGTGGTTLEDNIDIIYTGFKLKKDNCSEEFSMEAYNIDGNVQMINDILKKYYHMEPQLF